jgi:BirA family transcriptional regulator, biotin operon repressor / biotin---[acetyl-CoA-carboxylase] ligase
VDFARYVLDLERARPRPAAGGGSWPENLVVLSSTVSTNSVARGMASDFESEGLALLPTLVLALEQTGGRGRQGRTWSSPRGRGVYATLAQPYAEAELLPALPLLVGVGLCRALAPHLPHGCRLKWPNDVLVPNGDGAPAGGGGRKIGGVLIEARVQPEEGCVAIIGFGVNHGQRRDELPEGATSLLVERDGGAPGPGLADLTWELVAGVEAELAHTGDLGYAAAAYRSLSIHQPGDPLVWRAGDQEIAGTFAGFDDMGRLRLQPAGGGEPMVLSAGEVIES